MLSKKRKWSDEYVQHGFTCITERDGSQRPICMICNAKLSNSSLAPAKLKEHFLQLHGDGEYKNTSDVNARFILCTSKTYNYVLNLKKIIFYFSIKKGSVNAHMKLVGFSTSNKVKNHCTSEKVGKTLQVNIGNIFN